MKECEHEWRPIVDVKKLEAGCGSGAARIGSYCMRCKETRAETHLMERQLREEEGERTKDTN